MGQIMSDLKHFDREEVKKKIRQLQGFLEKQFFRLVPARKTVLTRSGVLVFYLSVIV